MVTKNLKRKKTARPAHGLSAQGQASPGCREGGRHGRLKSVKYVHNKRPKPFKNSRPRPSRIRDPFTVYSTLYPYRTWAATPTAPVTRSHIPKLHRDRAWTLVRTEIPASRAE